MKAFKRISLYVPLLFVLLTFSCEESKVNYSGLPIDTEILGNWHRSYSVVDNQMGITVYTDSIEFSSSNLGDLSIYKFTAFETKSSFQFYTEENKIYILFNDSDKEEIWPYYIRNDSLIISERLPFKR